MKTFMYIGSTKDSVKAARNAITKILKTPHTDEATKVKALEVLSTLCKVDNVAVNGCTFTNAKD
jgi:hypothetical protein